MIWNMLRVGRDTVQFREHEETWPVYSSPAEIERR